MTRNRVVISFLVAAMLLALPAVLLAQASGGDLAGKVVDSKKSPLPGVTVTATNKATGLKRLETTGADGGFRIGALPVGTYTVVADLQGFSTVTVDDVRIIVATVRNLEITMSEARVQESITVIDEAPLVETSPSIGTVVSQKEVESLPLNGRQFANLAILAPGTTLGYNNDPTKPGQLVVQLNGGSGRNVNYITDGGDNTDDTIGGALQNFNLEAVQEFKIQTMQYKAEYGRSTGGVLTVVTKSGTNDLKGSAYGFFRDKSLNSKTETEKLSGIDKQPYKRKQYGASIGGPIVPDKVHFFVTYEKTQRDTSYTFNSGGGLPALDGQSFPTPFTDQLATAKLTFDLSATQLLQVRYGYQKNTDTYGASPAYAPSSVGPDNNKYQSLLIGHTAQVGSQQLNELTLQYSKFDNSIPPTSSDPSFIHPDYFSGQNINSPQTTNQKKYQIKDDFAFSRDIGGRRHDFKAGITYIDEPTLGGTFTAGTAGQFTYLTDDSSSPITDITFFGGNFQNSTKNKQYGGYFQDDWYASDHLTFNLGVRYDYSDILDLDQRSNPIWQELSTQTTYHESYLRDFQGGKGGHIKADKNNWAPRLGFTWDMKGDGRSLLRGGVGRFYDFPYSNATVLFPSAAVQSTYGVVYNVNDPHGIKNPDGSFYQYGQPLPPNAVTPGVAPPNEVASPTLATPYSDQITLGYSVQATNWLGLNVEAINVRYRDLPFRFRGNPKLDANGNAQADRRFPDFGNFRIWYGNGFADYKGVNLGFRIRQPKFELQGFYTYSKATGITLAGADEFRIWDTGNQQDVLARDASINSLNPLCGACEGPLYTDARHRVTLGGTYTFPWDIRLSGFLRYHSGLPYTKYNQTYGCDDPADPSTCGFALRDLNGDSFRNDLAPGVSGVNTGRGDSFSQVDLRLSKEFVVGDFGVELIGEVFNLFNEKNPARYDRLGNPHSYAGDPLRGEQRLAQLGLRLRWK